MSASRGVGPGIVSLGVWSEEKAEEIADAGDGFCEFRAQIETPSWHGVFTFEAVNIVAAAKQAEEVAQANCGQVMSVELDN